MINIKIYPTGFMHFYWFMTQTGYTYNTISIYKKIIINKTGSIFDG